MVPQERVARALAAELRSAGIDARATGGGLHWHVDVGTAAARALVVRCFWYERAITGLLLGMNPANARSRLRERRAPYEGAEYLVELSDGGVPIADGRSHAASEVVDCARAWLGRLDLDELVRSVPFVDAGRRRMQALAGRLDPVLRREIGEDPSYELWIYGNDRSCRVTTGDDGLVCAFFVRQAQVALGVALDDVPRAVSTWLIGRRSLAALSTIIPAVTIERHAELLEQDPARWHWSHVLDRIANPDDVLAPMRDSIASLAASPVASTFYSFSSLDRFCFSASSHYPWVDEGLPVLSPADGGTVWVGDTRCDLGDAVGRVDSLLAASPVRPFFGSAPHHELPAVARCLAARGSELEARLVQRRAWYSLEIASASGMRECRVAGCRVTFREGAEEVYATWPTLARAVEAIIRYCGGASLDEVVVDAQQSLRGPGS